MEEEEAVYIRGVKEEGPLFVIVTNEDPPNAHQAQEEEVVYS